MLLLSLFTMAQTITLNDQTQQNIQLLVVLLIITLIVTLISRPLRLPYTLILVVVGLIIGFPPLLPNLYLDPNVVLFLFLPILLFEGAWNIDTHHLLENWLPVFLLAVPGLILSVLITSLLLHWSLGLPWLFVLLLGAIISPTDPIAVLALFRQSGLSERLRIIVEGESLFNDGTGTAIFALVLQFLLPSSGVNSAQHLLSWLIAWEFLWLILGGLIVGLLVGIIMVRLLRFVDDYLIEMTVTVSVAYGAYLLGVFLNTSGLLAVVGAGLVLGSYGQRTSMSERTRQVTNDIWEFCGYLANSLLFLLLGIQLGEESFLHELMGIGIAVGGVIIGRAMMIYVFLPLVSMYGSRNPSPREPIPARWYPIILFSGLRGALSIALVLSLPATLPEHELLQNIVYGVVLITLLGQGAGLRFLLPLWQKGEREEDNSLRIH